ncbi:Fizzy-related protein like [Schistosoma japonicum]|nr:Fizzy-related protein like [Schistosoma japonicum]
MKTPTKENYMDRYIPLRTNARWKTSTSFEQPNNNPTRKLFQSSRGNIDGLSNDTDSSNQNAFQNHGLTSLTGESYTASAAVQESALPSEPRGCDLLSALVANELEEASLGVVCSPLNSKCGFGSSGVLAARENNNMFSFKLRRESPCKLKTSPYTMSPVSEKSQQLLKFPQKQARKISRVPYKVLDAPELQDDFYLNLVDWSSQNVLAVGLGTCVYLWNAFTSQVTRLCDVSGETDVISSVAWSKKGSHLAIGTYRGHVQIWDVTKSSCIRLLNGHIARVGALAWNADLLASGSRDRYILLRDTRASTNSGGGPTGHLPITNPSNTSALTTELGVGDEIMTDFNPLSSPCHVSQRESDSNYLRASTPIVSVSGNPSEVDLSIAPGQMDIDVLGFRDVDHGSSWSAARASANPTVTQTTALQSIENETDRLVPGAVRVLKDHRQEVCGLKWSPDSQYLASGGNDNRLLVWSQHAPSTGGPVLTYEEHVAAVKAIAWSPHQHGLLASGGGTADRCIRFWNTLTGQALRSVDTGSQVCNIAWSIHSNELVSTHGYSQNQILVWKYPSLTQLVKLVGHSYRVLYLAISPDGENIVTGAGDETLRFWNIFTKAKTPKVQPSSLNLFNGIR